MTEIFTDPESSQPESSLTPAPLSGQMKRMNYGGAILEFPVEWDDNRIGAALKRFRESPAFYNLVDRETGATTNVRRAVGTAKQPIDRLNTLRKFHPDAIPFGDDNFIFTHPESGKPTLYNEVGRSWGDVASVERDIMVGVGATLGATAGWVSGLATGPGAVATSPYLAAMGAGGAGMATGTFYDFLAGQVLGTVDTRSLARTSTDIAIEGLAIASGERIGQIIGPPIARTLKRTLGGGTPRTRQIFDALMDLRITPTAGGVTAGRGAGRIESALDQASTSATIMRESIEGTLKETREAAERTARSVGTPGSQQRAGEIIQEGAEGATARYRETQRILEDALESKIGPDIIIPVNALRALRETFEARVLQAPHSLGPKYKGAIDEIKRIELDAEALGGIPYSAFREHRWILGRKMSDFTEGSANKALWKRIYGQMSKDLEEVIDGYAPQIRHQFDETMAFTRTWNKENADLFERLTDLDAPERAWRHIMNSRKDGGTVLAKLQNLFTKNEWDDITATIVQKMGYKNFGNEADDIFQVATFLTNYRSLSVEAKDALFRGSTSTLRRELDKLEDVFQHIAKNARLGNFSNTAGAAHLLDTLAALGFDTTSLAASMATGRPSYGSVKSIIGQMVGRLLFPRQIAKLITNAKFVEWLATPATTRPNGVAAHIARLSAVAKASPWIREEIHAFLETLSRPDEPLIDLKGESQ